MAAMLRQGRRAIQCLCAVGVLTTGCGEAPVIAKGRYFELASERDDPLCAGTADQIDAYLDSVADLLGERLPDRRFLRIEWSDVGDADGTTTDRLLQDDVIVTNDPIDPHELVHAAHLQVWPKSHRLLMEGLATMIGNRNWPQPEPWPADEPIDSVLGEWNEDYAAALFLVSQIIEAHGFDGLRQLWHAVPMGASAGEFRDAHRSLFGTSIDHLVEPKMVGPVPQTRFSCFYEICLEPVESPDEAGEWKGKAQQTAPMPRRLARASRRGRSPCGRTTSSSCRPTLRSRRSPEARVPWFARAGSAAMRSCTMRGSSPAERSISRCQPAAT